MLITNGKPDTRRRVSPVWREGVGNLPQLLWQGAFSLPYELLKDPITSTLVSNSEYVILLKQSAPDAAALLRAFSNISTAQIKYTTNTAHGRGLVKFGDTVIPFDNRIDKENPIYDVYNTNMHEKVVKRKARSIA